MPKKLLALCSLAAVLLTASAAPAVTSGEDTGVMVDALVLDHEGNPVPGLNRGDFEVIVGDRIRPVSGVQMVAAETAPRRFVFVFNRRGALPAQLKRAQRGLAEFISSRFGDLDGALFVDFAEVPRMTRGWRTGAAEALPEVHSITPMGFRSPGGPAEDAADAAFMLYSLAERLSEVPGRKVVILFSGSLSIFAGEPGGAPRGTTSVSGWPAVAPPESKPGADTALQSLARRFNASRATVYGLHLEGARRQEDGILVADRQEYNAGTGRTLARNTQAGRRQDAFTRPADDFLSSLAAETGGTYTARATDFARILDGIEASNRLWYELTFSPGESAAPGVFQRHEVRVRNRPGLTVVVRPGHVVPE